MTITAIVTRIVGSAGLAALGLSFAATSARAQTTFNPLPVPLPCGVGPRQPPCSGAATASPIPNGAITAIQNRNAEAQRAVEQGFNQLRNILQNRQEERERQAEVSDRLNKTTRSSEPDGSRYASSYPGDYFDVDSSPYAYAAPSVSNSAECSALRSTYSFGNPAPPAGCMSSFDWLSTYLSDGAPQRVLPVQSETVIDGSNIPSVIDFSGRAALSPLTTVTERVIQRGLDGSEIPSRIDFPCPPAPSDPSLSLFKQVSGALRTIACKQGLGR
jgi:hypothetical protein